MFTQLNLNITTQRKNFFFFSFRLFFPLSTIETRKIAIFIRSSSKMSPLFYFFFSGVQVLVFVFDILLKIDIYPITIHLVVRVSRDCNICYCPSPILSNLVTWKQYTLLFLLLLFFGQANILINIHADEN